MVLQKVPVESSAIRMGTKKAKAEFFCIQNCIAKNPAIFQQVSSVQPIPRGPESDSRTGQQAGFLAQRSASAAVFPSNAQ